VLLAAAAAGEVPNVAGAIPPSVGRHSPLVVTQLLPEGVGRQSLAARGESFPRARLLLIFPDSSTRVFSDGFFSARDPDVSFDGLRLLFSGKKTADDGWDIYEAPLDGRGARQITKGLGDCWNPCYQGTLFTLDSPAPWYQVTFVRGTAGVMNENDEGPRTNLYSCKLDGSAVRQLTFNLSSDAHPWQLDDGRVLLASWQRATLDRGPTGHVGLFAVNADGVDYSLFAEDHGSRTGHMPCVTRQGLVVFVETDEAAGDGAGWLASVTLRRPLHSYHAVTRPADGLFRCPAPLPDGRILACRKGPGAGNTYDVCCVDPASGTWETVFHDPQYSTVQVRSIYPRPEPDGRSSNVIEEDPHGKLYCLNVYTTDLANPAWLPPGSAKRLRVLEGVPRGKRPASAVGGRAPFVEKMAVRRLLDEVELADDGSFNIQIPANIPIQLQLVDARGMALRTCAWIWTKNHESRGCIGCHEDGEWVPENRFAKALGNASLPVFPPPEKRRTVDFLHDVQPILKEKCWTCHGKREKPLALGIFPGATGVSPVQGVGEVANLPSDGQIGILPQGADKMPTEPYVVPLKARASPLVWHLFGENTIRPWDGIPRSGTVKLMPPAGQKPLTDDERRVLIEWIDMGVSWDSCEPREK
jgi:hypothetical protein